MSLIQNAGLVGGHLGRKRRNQLAADQAGNLPDAPGKGGIVRGVFRFHEFKVQIKAPVAALPGNAQKLRQQLLLRRRILKQPLRPGGGKAAVLRERGQMQVGQHAVLRRK